MQRFLGRVGAAISAAIKSEWQRYHASVVGGDMQSGKTFARYMNAMLLIVLGIALPFWLVSPATSAIIVIAGLTPLVVTPFVLKIRHVKKIYRAIDERLQNESAQRQRDWMEKQIEQRAADRYRQRIERQVSRAGLPTYVYFVLDVSRSAVKIGISTDVQKRLGGLQTATATPLTLLATEKGGRRLEKRLHKRFDGYHISGEWFHYTEEIKRYIAEIEE